MSLKVGPLVLVSVLLLAACLEPAEGEQDSQQQQQQQQTIAAAGPLEGLEFEDVAAPANLPQPPPQLAIEVALDRLGFSSGVIDGKASRFDTMALRGFQPANSLAQSGVLDKATKAKIARLNLEPVRSVRIPQGFAQGPFVPDLPRDTAKQAGYAHLGYRNLLEALAERFHTTPELLISLNSPQTRIGPGTVIRVPHVGDVDTSLPNASERDWRETLANLGVSARQPQATRIVVSKSAGTLRAYDDAGRLFAQFPVTTGSRHDPLPIGQWKVRGVGRNPTFHYNPDLFWDVSDSEPDRLLKPGPNGPVGVVWIDLSKDHYGIHGTGEPSAIGQGASHGCVRLTNWDAARLAQMVQPGVAVIFEK